jgi:hypothetical protein
VVGKCLSNSFSRRVSKLVSTSFNYSEGLAKNYALFTVLGVVRIVI